MSSLNEHFNSLTALEKAELAFGFIYIIDLHDSAITVSSDYLSQFLTFDRFGKEDIGLHCKFPSGYRQYLASGLDIDYLAICVDKAFNCYKAYSYDPWYLFGREFFRK